MRPDDRHLREIIERIVAVAKPERIILFGSAARGEANRNSDVDLLIVKSGVHRRQLTNEIYRNLIGVGYPVDVIVVWPEDLERYRDTSGLVMRDALTSGEVVYVA